MNNQAPELEQAWKALRDDRLDEAIELATPHLGKAAPLGIEATGLVGLAEFHRSDYVASTPRMHEVARATNQPEDWFNLCTSATMGGQIDLGQSAFHRALSSLARPGAESAISMPQMRYYFAQALQEQGELRLALEQLDELRRVYEKLGITDSTFVYIRGVPMLEHTMEVALSLFRELGQEFDAQRWIKEFAARVDEEGARFLSECADRLRGAA